VKVAIPTFRQRIAPRFDSGCRVILVSIGEGPPDPDAVLVWTDHTFAERLRDLVSQGVELLVCGGLEPWMEESIRVKGIEVIPWAAGDLDHVLAVLADGDLSGLKGSGPGRGRWTSRSADSPSEPPSPGEGGAKLGSE
jgi:hypothetical protein